MGKKEIKEEFRVVMPHFLKYHFTQNQLACVLHKVTLRITEKWANTTSVGAFPLTVAIVAALHTEHVCGISDVN